MALGEILISLRKAKGLSQGQLAEELHLTRQTISKWELNQSTPDIAYLLQLSDFFGVSADYLIRGEESKDIHNLSHTGFESSGTGSRNMNVYKWCFLLGAIFIGVSLIGMIALVICSVLPPWAAIVNSMYFEGLLGFLFGTNTLWFFIVLLVLLLLGCCVAAYGIVKNRKS